jgi:hypothetical protein
MKWWKEFLRSSFLIKLRHWEYWPFGILQFPLFFYYPWLALRARSLTFFTGSNPGILMGGMFGESKFDVLELIPIEYKPRTIRIRSGSSKEELIGSLHDHDFSYPLIFKPDIGERGFGVRRISSADEALQYLVETKFDFLVQEFVDLPLEFGVFYRRFPQSSHGHVSSIVMKEMLCVEGDGVSTLQELILRKDRAKLQWATLQKRFQTRLTDVMPKGQKLEIVSIGNHCLGTKFINANHLINARLNESFDRISKQIPGFYFGRFDLRCGSLADLENGRIKIMELNGCGAEPAHIYDPDFAFWSALGVLFDHWKTIFKIAQQNQSRGFQFLPLKDAIGHYQHFKSKTR